VLYEKFFVLMFLNQKKMKMKMNAIFWVYIRMLCGLVFNFHFAFISVHWRSFAFSFSFKHLVDYA